MNIHEVSGYAIAGNDYIEACHTAVPHRRLNADLGNDAGNDQRFDSVAFQKVPKISAYEGAMHIFRNETVPGLRVETLQLLTTPLSFRADIAGPSDTPLSQAKHGR